MANIETGFPKNLSYNLKELAGGFNKQKVKVLGDLQTTNASGVVRYKLPSGVIVDLRSIVLYFTGSTAGTGSTTSYLHFPRYSSSLLQRITISANNITLCSINEYGLLYNALMEMEVLIVLNFQKELVKYLTQLFVGHKQQAHQAQQRMKMQLLVL